MQLYNSFTARKEPFHIPTDRPVTLYVCGVTPYDTTHVGHARTYIFFDTLLRYLRWQGADVRYCQNITDVDDPLFERARRDNIHWQDLAEREVKRFMEDCEDLNIITPDYFPKASEEIAHMLMITEQLIKAGYAYVRNGNVYFSIKQDPDFGKMARMGYDDMLTIANQRGNTPNDPLKDDPLDFVLWQVSNPGEPAWESPWGEGRPGWHIECSAMAMRYLGEQIDFHGGGSDLLFPHHSCEIAQSEKASGKQPFSHFWMHVGMVFLDGAKMSKSLGNLVFIRTAREQHDTNALRWYLLNAPYRDEFSYEHDEVVQTEQQLARLYQALAVTGGTHSPLDRSRACDAFAAAMNDDMNTPAALQVVSSMGDDILAAAEDGHEVSGAQEMLAGLAGVLGFRIG
jgi:L-cysteine:1D-myo-inositol 2-amino-2-deoxy-alpha-D-glucopyranoside ligase